MGGIMFIIGVIASVIISVIIGNFISDEIAADVKLEYRIVPLVAGIGLAIGMTLIGFIDDYIKVVKKRNLGLTAKQKTMMQLVISAAYLFSMYLGGMTYTKIPFIGVVDITKGFGLLFWPIAVMFIYGFTNAVNLTDGVDGLASSVTTVVAAFFIVASVIFTQYRLCTVAATAFLGGCLGFLMWNKHPAKVFMGDTGSMFLGGMAVALSFMVEMPIILMLAGIVYFWEAISVVIQVAYYKRTKKRIFKMTPIHHHYEMSGWSENKICLVFSVVAVVGCVVALLLFLY